VTQLCGLTNSFPYYHTSLGLEICHSLALAVKICTPVFPKLGHLLPLLELAGTTSFNLLSTVSLVAGLPVYSSISVALIGISNPLTQCNGHTISMVELAKSKILRGAYTDRPRRFRKPNTKYEGD
jgi:hypothetical protein